MAPGRSEDMGWTGRQRRTRIDVGRRRIAAIVVGDDDIVIVVAPGSVGKSRRRIWDEADTGV